MRRLITGLSLGLLLALTTPSSSLRLSPAEIHAAEFRFNLLTWEVSHLPTKWIQWLAMVGSLHSDTSESRLDTVETYFDLVRETNDLRDQTTDSSAPDTDTADPERDLASIEQRIRSLRPRVEEIMEAAVSDVLRQEDIPFNLGIFLFPPVDFSLGRLPTLLIISPRGRIERVESVLLVGGITPRARDELENTILRQEDVSALVSGIGGLSTYPSIIGGSNLRSSLRLAGHEWLHQYLIFHPLGQGYARSGNMASLNETAANIFGDELGDLVFTRLTGEEVPAPPGDNEAQPCPDDRFCYQREMQQTRLRVDELLEQGDIEQAEAYMEERRLIFVEHGHNIRKLNQAYFAFHGTYADSPASVSPIHQQLTDLRQASGSLANFIHTVAALSTYDELLTILEQIPNDS